MASHAMPSADSQDIVQPSKEWVLPARGKPGRKLSTNVPMTKRKAQNRASQRAFRERKHAYVLELQQKVAQFEAREIEANVQMQHLAVQYRQEADALREENARLTAKCQELSEQMRLLQLTIASQSEASHASASAPPPSSRSRSPLERAPGSPPPLSAPKSVSIPSLEPPTDDDVNDELDLDCIFCPGKSQCVCRGHASLPMEETKMAPTSSSAVALPSPAMSPGYVRIRRRTHNAARPPMHLWKTQPAPRTCTGNPQTCGACQSDPRLQQFCHTVSQTAQRPVSATRDSLSACESVPAAFQRLQSHPNFPKNQAGLDMLAEVVARDSVGEDSTTGVQDTPTPESSRVYVRTSAVSEALALLDKPAAQDVACPCPWAQTPSRLPWPR
ncbi:hypothetical protein MEQU1_002482 [Malassezia equina]|uniref:BZIP domain-containing protein n=1 Tax=Malassezia equina TaxID=1381935 RepID=A0AAF0EDY9_9BASI|nr:hypothetical protein MEQU1_002482 [Malassezia equina]